MINEQSKHIAYVLKSAVERQARTLEPSVEAEAAWVQTIIDLSIMREAFLKECTPGYYNNEGQPERMAKQNGSYGAGPVAFAEVLEDWRAEGSLKGLELNR
jgi:cyclohexanone monooxygenase